MVRSEHVTYDTGVYVGRYDRFAVVYADVFDSSISWDPETRWVWIDLLILAAYGEEVPMSRRDIAHRTKAPLEVVSRAIDKLLAPDPNSRCRTRDGRRLELIDPKNENAGFRLLTSDIHRKQSVKERRENKARYMRAYRARRKTDPELDTMKVGKLVILGDGEDK